MKTLEKIKLINDPVYGFISIPSQLISQLIEHRYFQRLRRIVQMGMTNLVFPGAVHTRFHHALGALFLMQRAVQVLRNKNIEISPQEEEALYIAILLHDIGHGPYSHAMEYSLVKGISHEEISLKFMNVLNREFDGKLTLGIQIFKNEYGRHFFHQLVAGQLDVDRLDYLKRDSFYTGVSEGAINSQRLIAMLNVKDDQLVVEEKGVYSVENFLIARRLMYWQVYLHKTGVVAEQMLVRVLKRARELVQNGHEIYGSNCLLYFLKNEITIESFSDKTLDVFSRLDDSDILCALKEWTTHEDYVLKTLSEMLLYRNLLKIKIRNEPFFEEKVVSEKSKLCSSLSLSEHEASYFIFSGKLENQTYNKIEDPIRLLKKDGSVVDVTQVSDQLNLTTLAASEIKYYMCFPKNRG